MDPTTYDQLMRAIASVGLPGVIAVGMIFILWQGLRILACISDTLVGMHDTLKTTVCPFANNPTLLKETISGKHCDAHPPVPSAASLQLSR